MTAEIIFDMPEDEYHAIQRMSSSGVRNMLISPGTFWQKSWLNPDREDKTTDAMVLGKAYHCARLEPEKFEKRYYRGVTPDMFEIGTHTQIKAALTKLGLKSLISGENVLAAGNRLFAAGQDAGIKFDIYQTSLKNNKKNIQGTVFIFSRISKIKMNILFIKMIIIRLINK